MQEFVVGVGSGTLAGSTSMGDGGRGFIYGCGRATGWTRIGCAAGIVTGAGVTVGGAVMGRVGMDEKNWGGS